MGIQTSVITMELFIIKDIKKKDLYYLNTGLFLN